MVEPIGQNNGWLPLNLFPFSQRSIDIKGNQIHYIDEGKGPVILFLHGNPTWSFLYRNIIKPLRGHFRCIAIDYPGFGLSKAKDGYDFLPISHAQIVEEFVLRLNLKSITLMVQDWGGPIGLWVAVRNPFLFKSLIIGNTWAWPVNNDPHFRRFSSLMGGIIGRFFIYHFNIFVNVLIPAGVKRNKISNQVMNVYRAPFKDKKKRMATNIFPREILASRDFLASIEERLPSIGHLPSLILWGDKDIAFRNKERERFEYIFQNHKTHILPGAGHYIQEDAAEEIVDAILEWTKIL